jgi:hypothetical protein
MAEFKISRIRYTWKGNWATDTTYLRDDVVRYGGQVWVCIREHAATAFQSNQDFLANPGDTDFTPAWTKMADGQSYRSVWQSSTLYNPGDIALEGGNLYLCVASHTSSSDFEPDISSWTLYAHGYKWPYISAGNPSNGIWLPDTNYKFGVVVRYGGTVYRCIDQHVSTSAGDDVGIEADQSKWEIVYSNTDYRGTWVAGTKYRVNDLVKYGGTLWRCKQGHTSGTDSTINFDSEGLWDVEAPGFENATTWNDITTYQIGDIVQHGGYLFYSLTVNYASLPTSSIYQLEDRLDPPDWAILSKGINFRGEWESDELYLIGDVVRRGGNIYLCLLDVHLASTDGSTLDYLDSTNWELLTVGQNWRNFWQPEENYAINDLVVYLGTTYQCNISHVSDNENYPGDNGNGYNYWDVVLLAPSAAGLKQRGDLLTYDLSRDGTGDTSTFGTTNVELGNQGQLVTINNEDSIFYKDYNQVARVFYVSTDGVDDTTDYQRGISPYKPWKTIRFACVQADDGFSGFTTIKVATGKYEEILPIIVPARTVVLGDELRSTTVSPAGPVAELALDSTYTIAVLNRFAELVDQIVAGAAVTKTPSNQENQVILTETVTVNVPFSPPQFDAISGLEVYQSSSIVTRALPTDPQSSEDVKDLIDDIVAYINFYVNSTGSNPTMTGSNTAVVATGYTNAVLQLEANKDFLAAEAVAYMQTTFPAYSFDSELCKRDVHRYIDAWKYDIINTGNYKSLLAGRYYRNAILGSASEDMFYLRDATGVRNCTLTGLSGILNPANVFDLYRRPTGGSFCSLDPGWGPADTKVWITTRSPYIQGVTTFGSACVGQKIDGSLHNGGNKSMVSNDFTQVISDGVGAWVSNNGRAELVSVFTYYCQVGYLSENGGIIRGTNGNCSYGNFGAVADGVDATEVPGTATINNRNQEASVSAAFAGDFVDEIQILEWSNAGQNYTQASATFVGAGVDASVTFEDFRDQAIFQSRLLDTNPDELNENVGGGGYSVQQNNAQVHSTPNGDLTSITIAGNDPNEEEDYLGKRIVLTSGLGTGQYGYITAYNTSTKVVSVARESDDQPGWDHVVPGKPITVPLNTSTTYRIEPRVTFSDPGFLATEITVPTNTTWASIAYGETTEVYTDIDSEAGTGETIDIVPVIATFDVTKSGRSYVVEINDVGAGYEIGQELTIAGDLIGGVTPENDITITVTGISDDSTNSIQTFTYEGTAFSGRFVAITKGGSAGIYSLDGTNWDTFNMPSSGDWTCLAAGDNKFVAIRNNSSAAASSNDGITWTSRSMPASRNWNSVVYGGGIFLAVAGNQDTGAISTNGTTWTITTLPNLGDSTFNEWVDVAYGKNRFVAVANSNNACAVGTYNSITSTMTWETHIMDVIDDSSQRDWVSVAYGNNRFVAISSQGDIGYSFDGELWYPATMPSQDGSTAHNWKKIRYAQGVFFAVGDTGERDVGADPTAGPSTFAATSFDGIVWTPRTLTSEQSWVNVAFGNPYIQLEDSSTGVSTPLWITIADSTDKISLIRTGARALGRASVVAGKISEVKLWDPGSGYWEPPTCTIYDPNSTSDALTENRIADGVLANPSWLNRGLGYRTASTRVSISGDGFADIIPTGKFITISNLAKYYGPGTQLLFTGNSKIYTVVTITELGQINGGLSAYIRVSPELKVDDKLEHGTAVSIRERYSQVRITGHDFLDVGTGNFEQTNYPELYSDLYLSAPENEVVEEDGGRVFYTSTDQSGNFRTGELFAVEQATGIVTISADFFDLSGLTELRLGGIRVGGTGAVIREFSTDALFTEDSNNIVPTERAIKAYLASRLSLGGSEIATASFIAGTVRVGPDRISNTASLRNIFPVRVDFDQALSGISGSMMAQTMFFRSFGIDDLN